MPVSPNTNNYTLGKGKIYFDKLVNGVYEGERDLGNTPSVSLSVDLETLDHFSSQSGLSSKDEKVVTSVTPSLAFTLDEVNVENLALAFMGTDSQVVQAANDNVHADIASSKKNRYFELGKRSVGVWTVPMDNVAGTFEVGETITGGTSLATAVISRVDANKLCVDSIVGTFQDDEEISGGTSLATADVNSATGQVFDNTDVVVHMTTTYYTKGTDYTVDSASGRVFITATSTIADASDIDVEFACEAKTYTEVDAFAETTIEGRIRFVSDNPKGINQEIIIYRCSITQSGEFGLISDEWQMMEFSGEILVNSEGKYYKIITDDTV